VKLFAARKLDEIDAPAGRQQATDRLLRFILTTTIRAGAFFEVDDFVVARLRRWHGGRPLRTRTEAARWLAIESPHWMDALHRAAASGWHRMVVDVGEAVHWYSDIHVHPDVWPRVFELTAAAALAGGYRTEEAAQRNYLGWARNVCQGRPGPSTRRRCDSPATSTTRVSRRGPGCTSAPCRSTVTPQPRSTSAAPRWR
jgi:hypothetical protein